MNRRELLCGSAGLPLLGTAILIGAKVRDPHGEWLKYWRNVQERLEVSGDGSIEEKDALHEIARISKQISETPPSSLEGAAAQLEWVIEDGECSYFEDNQRSALKETLSFLKRELR